MAKASPRACGGLVVTRNRPPDPASAQHGFWAGKGRNTAPAVFQNGASDLAVAILQKANGFGVFDQLNVTGGFHRGGKRAHDRFARQVASDASDARMGMRGFQTKRELAVGCAIKRHAKLDQVAHPFWAIFGN